MTYQAVRSNDFAFARRYFTGNIDFPRVVPYHRGHQQAQERECATGENT
jgi:hypothetical protein